MRSSNRGILATYPSPSANTQASLYPSGRGPSWWCAMCHGPDPEFCFEPFIASPICRRTRVAPQVSERPRSPQLLPFSRLATPPPEDPLAAVETLRVAKNDMWTQLTKKEDNISNSGVLGWGDVRLPRRSATIAAREHRTNSLSRFPLVV